MPNYGVAQAGSQAPPNQGLNLTVLNPGDAMYLFNAETPTAPQASVAFCRGVGPMEIPAGLVFTIKISGANPTDTVLIQGSNTDLDADYQTVFTSTNKQFDYYADIGEFSFYRAKLNSGTSGGGGFGTLTVLVQR